MTAVVDDKLRTAPDQEPTGTELTQFGKLKHPIARLNQRFSSAVTTFLCSPVFLLLKLLPAVRADGDGTLDVPCSIDTDISLKATFDITTWINRGICIRTTSPGRQCNVALLNVLKNMSPLATAQCSGAAGVLALLPTIGALLGAPTNEIWRLLTIVPFGGVLAMFMSFGGAILPIRVEDYESAEGDGLRPASMPGRSFSLRRTEEMSKKGQLPETGSLTHPLLQRLEAKLHQEKSVHVSKHDIWLGLFAMLVLLLGAHAAMVVVEQGAMLPWFCWSRGWWMHFWYILVTFTAILDNYAQLPFKNYAKLYLSDVPYDITVAGGEDITKSLQKSGVLDSNTPPEDATGEAIGLALEQLKTVQAGVVYVNGSLERAQPRNAVLVMVSVVSRGTAKRSIRLLRLLSKTMSIAVFVVGTAFFSSAQLLAPPVAIMVLSLLLAAAVGTRAVATYITTVVGRSEPMIHVMVNSQSEANKIIAEIMMLTRHDRRDPNDPVRAIQIEVDGHVFVDCKRVTRRSRLFVAVLGIMAEPFDLASIVKRTSARGWSNYSGRSISEWRSQGMGDVETAEMLGPAHLQAS
ncbi:hypothetical protein QQS21_003843 [Conoideocrella luteorostrata]|uniref:Uncharacterized protein n=1 Tax=Conoideocrella luteorostrata TaxID=1105319 RepID=A0AAJ0CVF5_9HYPO|nr:hypothetical protein QQS21_003843 [Conoideocrella luteorostrata]